MKTFFPYPFYPDDVPIDISFIFEDERPAGKHGFLGVDGRSLCFEDGTVAKFWGTNFNGAVCFPRCASCRIALHCARTAYRKLACIVESPRQIIPVSTAGAACGNTVIRVLINGRRGNKA